MPYKGSRWGTKNRKGAKLHEGAQEDLNESEEVLQDAPGKQRESQEYRRALSKAAKNR